MMAAAIGCDLCQQEPAEMMQTVLTNGATISVGHACMITFFAGALTGMLSDAPPQALNDLAAVLAPLAAIIGPSEQDMKDGIPPALAPVTPAGVPQQVTPDEMERLEMAAGFDQAHDDQEGAQQ